MRLSRINVVALCCALCLALFVSGCTQTSDPSTTRPAQEPTGEVTDSSDVEYGLVETGDTITATGRLLNIDDEEGLFWAVVREQDPPAAAAPPLIAVISNPDEIDANEHNGEVVRITGVEDPDQATDRGAPVIRAEELETLADPVDPDAPIAE